jgi:hypothetical protein
MAVCIKCKERISEEDKFCSKCGHKRETCSCGAFIDYKPNFCAECGKMTHYAPQYYRTQLDAMKLELESRKQRLEDRKKGLAEKKQRLEEKQQEVAKEKQRLKEKRTLWEKREREVKKLAKELGFETGLTLEELKNNFIVGQQAIQLNYPIDTVYAIKKEEYSWRALNAENLVNIEDLKKIYKIKDFCEIDISSFLGGKKWCVSSSFKTDVYPKYYCLNFNSGEIKCFSSDYMRDYGNRICVFYLFREE